MLPCRLVLFFARVREFAPQWQWSFRLSTTAHDRPWTEDEILQHGWPRDSIYGLDVTVICPVPNGCFIAYRRVNHQRAARFFAAEARQLVDDIAAEFAPRLRARTP